MPSRARKKALQTRKRGDDSNDFENRINNAPASWTAVTSEAKSPLWLRLAEGLGLQSEPIADSGLDSFQLLRRQLAQVPLGLDCWDSYRILYEKGSGLQKWHRHAHL